MALPSLFIGLCGASCTYSLGVSKSAASSLDSLCRLQNACLRPSCSGSQRVTHHAANFMFPLHMCGFTVPRNVRSREEEAPRLRMTLIQLGPLGKKLPWFMEGVCGRIISEFLLRPNPLCAAIGPIIREVGRQEISCYCDCHENFRFEIEFNQLHQNAMVTERVCRMCLVEIRALDPNLTAQQYEQLYDGFGAEHERAWDCNLLDVENWQPMTMALSTWQEVADLVDVDSMVEV